MANAKHEPAATPLLSDDDLERTSVAQDSFEYVDYESSEPESLTLSGSTVIDDTPLYNTSFLSKDEEAKAGGMSDPEALPKYEPRVSETEIVYSKRDSLEEGLVEEGEVGGNKRCRRRRCFRGRCRRASTKCDDKKRRVRRRIVMFIKAMFLFGLFSFVMTRMCLRHRRVSLTEYAQDKRMDELTFLYSRLIRKGTSLAPRDTIPKISLGTSMADEGL